MNNQSDGEPVRDRRVRVAGVFLSLSYGIAAPVTAFVEYRGGDLSQRFDLPPTLIYAVCAVQCVCAIGILVRRFAPWAAAALTVITLGALASHLKIGSPLTALPALIYTVIQVWYGLRCRAARLS